MANINILEGEAYYKFIDPEGWDYPPEELTYLEEEHDGDTFVLKGDRFYEVDPYRVDELLWSEVKHAASMLKRYTWTLAAETYCIFGIDEMVSLEYFLRQFRSLDSETDRTDYVGPEYAVPAKATLCNKWIEYSQEIQDNIECLRAGVVGL